MAWLVEGRFIQELMFVYVCMCASVYADLCQAAETFTLSYTVDTPGAIRDSVPCSRLL